LATKIQCQPIYQSIYLVSHYQLCRTFLQQKQRMVLFCKRYAIRRLPVYCVRGQIQQPRNKSVNWQRTSQWRRYHTDQLLIESTPCFSSHDSDIHVLQYPTMGLSIKRKQIVAIITQPLRFKNQCSLKTSTANSTCSAN